MPSENSPQAHPAAPRLKLRSDGSIEQLDFFTPQGEQAASHR